MGGQDVQDPLSKPGEELGIVDRALATPGLTRCGNMQEHKVEIGTIAQFKSAQLSIGDNGKSRLHGSLSSRQVGAPCWATR